MFTKNWKILLTKLEDNRGSVLLTTYMLTMVLLILGAAFLVLSSNESRISEVQRKTTQSFYIAEAGIERAIYDLKEDFVNSQDWADNDINSWKVVSSSAAYYPLPDMTNVANAAYPTTALGDGSYTVSLKNVDGTDDIWIRSTGTIGSVSQTILVYVKIVNLSPWVNAIFGGSGAVGGSMVKGNVIIAGSVHILGNGLADDVNAIDLTGGAVLVENNYGGMPAALELKVPALPTITLGEDTVETLSSELRVKKGLIGLSGTAEVGEDDAPGDADNEKEMIDGAYVTDGYDGNQGAANVNSDNGTDQAYDLGDAVTFPHLSDISAEDAGKTIQEYFEDQTPVHSNPTAVDLEAVLSSLTAASDFEYYDDVNGNDVFDVLTEHGISMDGDGNMVISGQIYVEGPVSIIGADVISYEGTGTILAEGDVTITTSLVTAGINSYPAANGVLDAGEDLNANGILDSGEDLGGILGIMTPGNMILGGAAQLDIMGLFYAEGQVVTNKQTNIVGTLVTNYFNAGINVPAIFQVPETANNLPPGMISGDDAYFMKVVSWQKIDNP